jgi:hypothetical protein
LDTEVTKWRRFHGFLVRWLRASVQTAHTVPFRRAGARITVGRVL